MAKVLQIASGKGGTGKTTVTVLLSYALANMGFRVLTIDTDIGFKSLGSVFGVSENILFHWGDVIRTSVPLDKALIPLGPQLDFLSAPVHLEEDYTAENFQNIIDAYKAVYDYILIDSPAGLTGGFSLAANVSDITYLVVPPTQIAVQSAGVTAETLHRMHKENIYLIINQFSYKSVRKRRQMNIDDMIDTVGAQLIGVLPYEKQLMTAQTQFIPSVFSAEIYHAISRIARRIAGEDVPLLNLDKM